MGPGLVAFLFFELALLVVGIVAGVKIIIKAGYSGWWFLIFMLPLVGFIMFVAFAFSKWPIQQRLEQAERRLQSLAPNGPYGWAGGGATSWAPPGAQGFGHAPGPPQGGGPRQWDSLR